jgi:hypothetical protein
MQFKTHFSDGISVAFADSLLASLQAVPSGDGVFNLYRDVNPELDVPGAAQLRCGNLRRLLVSRPLPVPLLVVVEAPGWRGCRFSGIPITSEALLAEPGFPWQGQATRRDGPLGEQSATIFHRAMAGYHGSILVWNTFPFHPHRPGEPCSNRTPSRKEQLLGRTYLEAVLAWAQPQYCAAVGRIAQRALSDLGQANSPIRHPAQGGAAEFARGMAALLRTIHEAQALEVEEGVGREHGLGEERRVEEG